MSKRTIKIRFTTDKNGKPRAHYWGSAYRWLPIGIAAAKLKLASGEAVENETASTVAKRSVAVARGAA